MTHTQAPADFGSPNLKSVSPAGTHKSEALREMNLAVADAVEEPDTFDVGFITFFP